MEFGRLLSNNNRDRFFIMHLSYNGKNKTKLWNYAVENELIGLDVPGIVPDNLSIIRRKVTNELGKGWTRQFNCFCDIMRKGDFVMVFDGMSAILGVAKNKTANHRYDRSLSQNKQFFDHIRDVEWIRKSEFIRPIRLKKPLYGFSNTLTRVPSGSPRWPILTLIEI
jgi:hypothetical protein